MSNAQQFRLRIFRLDAPFSIDGVLTPAYRPEWAAANDPHAPITSVEIQGLGVMDREDALAFAAWILALVEPHDVTFRMRVRAAKEEMQLSTQETDPFQ